MKTKCAIIAFICIFNFICSKAQSPSFAWAKSMGGAGHDYGQSIKINASGSVFIAGVFNAMADFDPGPSSYFLTSKGFEDIFISKLDANGNLVWAKQIGGPKSQDILSNMTIDKDGNIFITGWFNNACDFDPDTSSFILNPLGNNDAFIAKYDASGKLIWAKQIGGSNDDLSNAIAVDDMFNVYITGSFRGSVDFDPNAGSYQLSTDTTVGNTDIFILKLDAQGNFVWAKDMKGTKASTGNSIAVDAKGNVFSIGAFQGTVDFNPNAAANNLTAVGSTDIFILKLDATGNYLWAKQFGETGADIGTTITTDVYGSIFASGSFKGVADFDPGPGVANLISEGMSDIFILKLNADGNFVWAKNIGGSDDDFGNALILDFENNIYLTGGFSSTADFDPGQGSYNLTSAGITDMFIVKLDLYGNFRWAIKAGNNFNDAGNALGIDYAGNIYCTGRYFETVDFDPGAGAFLLSSAGSGDIFIEKLHQNSFGIIDKSGSDDITITPNPGNGIFYLDILNPDEFHSIRIYNNVGELIANQSRIQNLTTVDLAALPAGLYLVELVGETNIFRKKIIKQ